MSISIVCQEFETPKVVHDKASASGKSIIWPSSPTAKLVSDEGSPSGKSIVWTAKASCASLAETLQTSVASTRANSPADSSGEEDEACEVPTSRHEIAFGDTADIDMEKLALRHDVRNAILDDLGVELETCDSFSASGSSTTAGSPYPSSVASSPYLSSAGSSPIPASPTCAIKVTGTRPPVICTPPLKDASQRSPAGFLRGPRPADASQRTPQAPCMLPQRVAQRINGGLRRVGGGDASERYPAPVAGGSWAAAANCVAATRAAAAPCASTPAHTAPASHPDAASLAQVANYPDAASLAQVALAAVDAMTVAQQVSTTPSVAVSFVSGEASPQASTANVEQLFVAGVAFPQASPANVVHVYVAGDASPQASAAHLEPVRPAEALKSWLAGSTPLPESLPSGEELDAALRASLGETYFD